MSKENTVITKIPIPLDSLPPLPKLAQRKRLIAKPEQPRHPLETQINMEEAVVNRKVKKVVARSNSALTKLDTPSVTIRKKKNEELDWSYTVFNDNLHDDHDNKARTNTTFTKLNTQHVIVQEKDKEELDWSYTVLNDNLHDDDGNKGDCGRVSTPAFKPLPEPVRYRIRKVKKSAAVSGDKGEEKVKRRLDFTDHAEPTSDSRLNSYSEHYIKDYGLDLFDYLLKREMIPKTPRMSNSKRARIVNWMVKADGPKGNPAVVQTAAWYFDHMLAVGADQVDKLRVVAAACYWIALKMHVMHDMHEGHVTSAKKLQLPLEKFPIQPVVPQDFISYWSWVCDASNYAEIEAAATLLYMASLVMHHKLVQHYPSVLAAAAMNNALHLLRRKELFGKLTENAVYKVAANKEHLGDFCLFQRKVLREMSSPFYIHKALLNTSKDYTLTDKILTSLKKNK